MKVFRKIIKILSLILILLLVIAVGLAYLYEDEIKLNVINKINSEVKADVNVEEINFSLIKRFPFASLQLKNVFLLEKLDNKGDTIFSASSLHTKFKILDLLKNEYNISNIELQNPRINFKIFKNGSHNFDIFYESNDSIESPLINLEKIKIVGGEVFYTNEITSQFIHLKNNEIIAKGVFAPKNLEINFISDLIIKSYVTDDKEIISDKFVKTDLKIFYDKNTNKTHLKNAYLNYNGLALNIIGEIINDENINLNIELNAEKLDLNKALKEIPESSLGQLKNYDINAEIDLIIDVKGIISKYKMPDVKGSFSVYKANIKHKSTKESIDNIIIRGDYENGLSNNLSTSKLHIQEFSFNADMGSAKGYLNIENLLEPKANINFDADIDLEKIERFLEISAVKKLDGNLKLNLSSSFRIINIYNEDNIDIQFTTSSGKADISDANLVLSNDNSFENIETSFIFSKEKLKIHNLSCNVNGHSTNFEGNIYNLDKFLLNPVFNNRIIIAGNLVSDYLDVDKLLYFESDNSSSPIKIKYEIKLNLIVKGAKYLGVDIDNFNGNLFYNEDLTKVNIINASLFDGDVSALVEYNTAEKTNNLLSVEGKTFGVNIEDIFKQYNNFDQEYITHKNISGKLWSDFNLRILESKEGKWLTKSLNLSSSIELKDGELKDVNELNALSKFTKIDDFSDIKFSTIKNDIYILREEIRIPQMDINSDKMNISLYGKHKFDNSYEYHFKIRLAEILAKNVRQNKKSEFGEIVDDETGMNIFLKIIGNGDDYEVSYDGKAAREKLKGDLKTEGQEIKDALKKEFGSKKKEKPKTEREKEKEILEKQTEGETVIEWEDF